jgi:AcrR family transcriptional regulator
MGRGRPRTFDTEEALEAAMQLFWRRGYEGTSLAALTEAMGVNVPSLYAAFGNKEQLFRRAVQRYIERPASYVGKALGEPTARAVAEQLFRGAINMVVEAKQDGCLLVVGALSGGPDAAPARVELSRRRAAGEAAIRKRFERALDEGDLSPDADTTQLARYVITVLWGMSVQAAGGATRQQLREIAEFALRAFPDKPQ